jgi:hypothetical protein
MSAEALVNIDESIALPLPISRAFNRTLGLLARSDAFVDRVFALHEAVSTVNAWRWADTITGEQCAFLLRKLRKEVQDELGAISQKDGLSAGEVEAREIAHAEWEEERQALKAGNQ